MVLQWFGFGAGLVVLGGTIASVLGTLVVPRGIDSRVSRACERRVDASFALITRPTSSVIDGVAAFTGLVVVGLQIGYLPTLYAAFNRRETEVTLLGSRAGAPTWGPEILVRTRWGIYDGDTRPVLNELFDRRERWSDFDRRKRSRIGSPRSSR